MYTVQYIFIFYIFIFHISSSKAAPQSNADSIWTEPWTENENEILVQKLSSEKLIFKGGIELKSSKKIHLGGLSALTANYDGSEIFMVSDFSSSHHIKNSQRSCWYTFRIAYNSDKSLKKATLLRHGHMYHPDGSVISGEIESMAQIDSLWYFSFDNQRNRGKTIYAYPSIANLSKPDVQKWLALPELLTVPSFPKEHHNEGIESLTETANNELFMIHETKPDMQENSLRYGWIINPSDKNHSTFTYKSRLEQVKGATTLANGNILILEKTFHSKTKSTHINIVEIEKSAVHNQQIEGNVILDVASPLLDNFEGITSFKKNGMQYILILSDNNGDWNQDMNGNNIQKSILLLFQIN